MDNSRRSRGLFTAIFARRRARRALPTLPPSNTFTCDLCKKTFEKGQSDEAALDQLATAFPGTKPKDAALLCDKCFVIALTR